MSRRDDKRAKPPPPLLGDGSVVSDYTLLYEYWEALRRQGKDTDTAVLQRSDFDKLREIIEREGGMSLEELLERLSEHLLPRIDREAAREAATRTYGVDMDSDTAARRVARIMAGWLVEAGKQTGMLRLRGPQLPSD